MRYDDASGSFSSQGAGATDARDDADALPAGSRGPATGNTITGEGTITGAAGADVVGNGPGKIVALEGAGGSDTSEGGSFHVEGRFGEITMDSRGGYSYTPHAAKPEGGSDVFRYTLADADGARDTATLTIDIGREIEKIDANAQQIVPGPDGVVTLPPGVQLSDILVVGRNLVINLPDGTQMIIIDGAVFVPQLVLDGVEVPASNLAALLIDAEPRPAAGTPTSSGGNFAVDVPPLDPGVPLGDLLPPTELSFTPPTFEDIGQFIDEEPEIFIQPDGQPAAIIAVDDVHEAGLPARPVNEPAGSGESADGNSTDNDDPRETTTGTILIDSPDDPSSVSITVNGTTTVVTSVGQVIVGQFGNLTITSISDTAIGYSYTLRDNTSGDATHDDFSVTVTDNDGDTATATLRIDIIDDVPTARNDTDAVLQGQASTTGNVMTGVGTTNSPAGIDTVGADDALVTAVSGAGGSDSSFNESGNLVVTGSLGTLTINATGGYTYVANADSPGGTDVFTYTLTDGDGDPSNATLTITVPADLRPTLDLPTAGEAGTVVDEAGLPAREGFPEGSGEAADPAPESDDSETTSGTITFTPGDAPAVVRIDGVIVTGTVGQTFAGDHGVLTITGFNAATGTITYSYTLTENTSGDDTDDSFVVSVTDADGDVASGTLVIDIIDDVPTARPDTDTIAAGEFGPATGNVITDAAPGDAGDGDDGADTLGADNAVVTSIDNIANATPAQAVPAVGSVNVAGEYGTLTIFANGDYSYTRNEGTPGGVTETFSYTITDGDGDPSTSTLTITIENRTVVVGQNAVVRTDDDAVPGEGGNPGGVGDDVDAENLTGTLSGSGGDGPLTFDLLTTGAPDGFTYVDGPNGSILVQQVQHGSTVTVLTITIDPATGAYTVTQNAAILHPTLDGQAGDDTENNVSFTVNYTVTDVDGDSAAGTLTIDVDDDTPEVVTQTLLTGVVDEDGLPDGNPGGVNDVPDENVVATGNVAALFSPGADQPLTYSLLTDTSGLPELTSNDVPVTYSVSGNTLTASAGGNPVFTFTVNATTGDYTFTLLDQLDHDSLDGLAGDDTENPEGTDIQIALGSIIQATDADGDSVTAPAGGLVITVDDDSPEEFEECPDDVIAINNPGSTFTGNLNLPPVGADEPGTVSFVVEDGDPVLDSEGQPVTSNGEALFYFVNADGVLEARAGDENGDLVFTVTINGDGTFTYEQLGPIGEGGGTSFDDLTSTSAGNAEFRGVGADDPATTVDLLLSAEAGGADATVNTDSDSIGADNQSMDAGETVRIDFVTDLTSGAGTPSGFGYTGHVSSNSFIGLIPQVQGSQSETVAFTVWALDTSNTQASEPDRDPAGGFSDSTITPVTEVTVTDYLTGDTTTVDVTGFTVGVFTAVDYGISVRVNADGSVTFAGIQEGDGYGFSTGTGEFNAVAVQAEPAGTGGSTEDSFDLGTFSIGMDTVVEPVELTIPIALTDSDGDSVVCDIDVILGPPVDAPNIAVTVNEAGLPVIGSDAASDSETQSGDLQGLVTGGTGPYTFTLIGSGDGAFGTLELNSDGTFTYTLDTPVDTQPDADDGANPEIGAESFAFEAEDANGNTQTGTITVNIIDDVPSIDVTSGADSAVLVQTQDADTIDAATDTASSSANFGGVFGLSFVAGADGAAAIPVLNYTLGVSAPAVDSGLNQGGADIFLHLIGGKVVGSTSNTLLGVDADNTVFDVSVSATGVVTLTQYSQIDHPIAGDPTPSATPFADHIIGMADGLVTLTASATVTDNDGDTATDSETVNIGANLQFADDGPIARNDSDSTVEGGSTGGNVLTGAGTDTGVAGADSPGADGFAASPNGAVIGIASVNQSTSDLIADGAGNFVLAGEYGTLTLNRDGTYTYVADPDTNPTGPDVFTYTVRDADGDTSQATLTINVNDVTLIPDNDTVTVNEAALDTTITGDDVAAGSVTGSNPGSTAETVTGTLTVAGATTYTLDSPSVGTFGTLVLNADGTYTYTLTAPFDTSPDADNGTNTELGAEVFTYTATDANGNSVQGTITINIVDDVPSVDVTKGADAGVILQTDDAQTIDAATDTASSSANFGGVFGLTFVAGADGAATPTLSYSLNTVGGASGLTQGGAAIFLYSIGGKVVGSTSATEDGVNLGNTVFDVGVSATGVVTLTQYSQIDHPIADDPTATESPFADDVVSLADGLITLTASSTITDNDGDTDTDSETVAIGANLQFTDDGPVAVNDSVNQPVENANVTVNVFANDSGGADGVNLVTGVAVVPGSLTGSGSLIYNGDGTFTYDPAPNEEGSITFDYEITDADGDTDTATVTINLQPDSTPAPVNAVASIDDEGLPNGILGGDGDLVVPNTDGDNDESTFGGTLTANFGGDAPGTFSFAAMDGETGTVGTEDVEYSWDGTTNTLTATITSGARTGTDLFEVTVTPATGAYSVTLLTNVLHTYDGTNTENDATAVLTFTATDSELESANATLTITFDDDMPQAIQPDAITEGLNNEVGAEATADLDDDLVSEVITDFGADGPGLVTFANITNGEDSGLTSNDDTIEYFLTNNGQTLEARTNATLPDGSDGDLIFTVAINQADGDYTVTMFDTIDNGSGVTFSNLTSSKAGNVDVRGVGADDPTNAVDLLLTASANGANATINTSSTTVGAANQSMDQGETIRIDLVSNLRDDTTDNTAAFPSGFLYDDHVGTQSLLQFIPQVQGNQDQTVAFQVYALNTTVTQAGTPDDTPGDGFSDSTIVPITHVTVDGWNDGPVDPSGPNEPAVTVAIGAVGVWTTIAYGVSAQLQADGSVIFSGIQEGDQYGIETGTDFNAVAITSLPAGIGPVGNLSTTNSFDLGVFSIGSIDTGDPINLSYDLAITDGDGDTVTMVDAINITIDPAGTPAPLAASTMMVSQESLEDTSSFSLMSSDSLDNHRTMSAANNNSVLLGAIAAAGLGVSSAAAAEGFGSGGNHMMLDTLSVGQGAATMQGFAIDNRDMARDAFAGEAQAIPRAEEFAGSSFNQSAIAEKLSLTDVGGDQGQAPMALLQATEMQHSDLAQSTLTSAAVGMPSAQMLAPKAEELAVDGQARGTAEVGRVLIDALAGGGSGPSIDAVIDAVTNGGGQGVGAAALEALATHGAASVSAWHTAGINGFTGGNSGITMDVMVLHHDAVQSAA